MRDATVKAIVPVNFAPMVKRWVLLASQYLGAQIGIKTLSMLGALLLVNLLPVQEYGIYTLLLANLTFLNGVSDFGATGSLYYFWRRAKRRAFMFQHYLAAVLRLRTQLFLLSAVASVVYLFLLSSTDKYDPVKLISGSALMLLATWFLVQVGTWNTVLKIEGRFGASYAVELAGEATKLLAVLLVWAAAVHSSSAAMACMLAGSLASAYALHRLKPDQFHKRMSRETRKERQTLRRGVAQQILPTAPWTLFFVAQGPLVAWMAATFGSSQNLGEIGALGRLSSIIALISGFTVGVLVPRLNNIHDEKRYIRYYLAWWVVLLAVEGTLLGLAQMWPGAVLWLIGHQYSGLQRELLVALLTAVVMTFEWYAGSINRARGWMQGQFRRIAFILAGQVALLRFLDFSRTDDLLLFSLGTAVLTLIVQLTYNVIGFAGALRQIRN